MDNLPFDTDLPRPADLAKCVVAFSHDVRRCGVNANREGATLDNFDGANFIVRLPRQRSLHRIEVRLGYLRWPHNVCRAGGPSEQQEKTENAHTSNEKEISHGRVRWQS